jgi:hypothetical protein
MHAGDIEKGILGTSLYNESLANEVDTGRW